MSYLCVEPSYREWTDFNRLPLIRVGCLLCVKLSVMLIPFDFLLFGRGGIAYLMFRCAMIVFCALQVRLIDLAARKKWRVPVMLQRLALVVPLLAWNVAYACFLGASLGAETGAFFLRAGNLTVILCAIFLVHRFQWEQYALTGLSLLFVIALGAHWPGFREDALLLTAWHVVSLIAAQLLRQQFLASLRDRFTELRSVLPTRIARYLAIAQGNGRLMEDAFQPRDRFLVCLCADWRDYQNLATERGATLTSELFRAYYEIVFEELDRAVPEGTYYADWTADQLFVIFYGEERAEQRVLTQSLEFAHRLATEVSERIRKQLGFELVFDIGMAAGYGLLGLQGPRQRKKTTVTAVAAGIAKRLEGEAKRQRQERQGANPYPILMMDRSLGEASAQTLAFRHSPPHLVVARIKNLRGDFVYRWQRA